MKFLHYASMALITGYGLLILTWSMVPELIYKPEVIGHGAAIGCLCGFTGLMVMARRGR